jgi:hypothetical protein
MRRQSLLKRIGGALGIALVLTTAVAAEQLAPDGWFRVSWEVHDGAVPPRIEGRVHNDSPYRVTDVRLRLQGFDAENHGVGQRDAWAVGDIDSGGDTSFVAEAMPEAVQYRIAVQSFDIVSVSRGR